MKKVFVEFDPPPMVFLNAEERAKLVAKAKDPIVAAAFDEIRQQADKALAREPAPLEKIHYEGRVSSDRRRVETVKHLKDMLVLRALLWAHVMTKDKRYGDKAKSLLMAWATTYKPTGNDVNENKLDSCFLAYYLLKDSVLSDEERETVAKWLESISSRHGGSGGGNRAAKGIKISMLGALVLDKQDKLKSGGGKLKRLIRKSLCADGTSHDLHARDSMHYHTSCLKNILEVLHVVRGGGVKAYDVESKEGGSLKKSVDYVLPYVRGEKIHKEWVNTKVGLDKSRWRAGDPYYRPGKPWDPTEAYEMLVLASTFDPSLAKVAQSIKPKNLECAAWLAVLANVAAENTPE